MNILNRNGTSPNTATERVRGARTKYFHIQYTKRNVQPKQKHTHVHTNTHKAFDRAVVGTDRGVPLTARNVRVSKGDRIRTSACCTGFSNFRVVRVAETFRSFPKGVGFFFGNLAHTSGGFY